jgi:hypothetical protein
MKLTSFGALDSSQLRYLWLVLRRWLVAGGWWLVAGGWWLVAGGGPSTGAGRRGRGRGRGEGRGKKRAAERINITETAKESSRRDVEGRIFS